VVSAVSVVASSLVVVLGEVHSASSEPS